MKSESKKYLQEAAEEASQEPLPPQRLIEDVPLVKEVLIAEYNAKRVGEAHQLGSFKDALGTVLGQQKTTLNLIDSTRDATSNPGSQARLQILRSRAESVSASILEKISEQQEGKRGWYRDVATGKKYYVKYYDDPAQASCEFIANSIYRKLGVPVVNSVLGNINGKIATLSEEIPGAHMVDPEELKTNPDIQNAFIADVFLGNSSVFGLAYESVVKGGDGRMYRTGNEGSLMYTPQGTKKSFGTNTLDDIHFMQQPSDFVGKYFTGLPYEEICRQAKGLVAVLSIEDIERIVDDSALSASAKYVMKQRLKDRREYLLGYYGSGSLTARPIQDRPFAGLQPDAQETRISRVVQELEQQAGRLEEMSLRPRVGILSDQDHVENQQIDIIDAPDKERYELHFKLTYEHYKRIIEALTYLSEEHRTEDTTSASTISVRNSGIYFNGFGKYGVISKQLTLALEINYHGIIVKVSTGLSREAENHSYYNKQLDIESRDFDEYIMRSCIGLVHIEIPYANTPKTQSGLEDLINNILSNVLDVPTGLLEPDKSAERQYKKERYKWHHKTQEVPRDIDDRLKRVEAFPGYFTFVEAGVHETYQQISPYAVYHSLYSEESLLAVLKSGGLMSTHQRYQRGLLAEGVSSDADIRTGGS